MLANTDVTAQAKLEKEHPDYVVGSVGRICILRTMQPLTPGAVAAVAKVVAERDAQTEGPQFVVLAPCAPRPTLTTATRVEIRKRWGPMSEVLVGGAIWIRRSGFVAAAQRSLVTAVLLAFSRGRRIKTVASADEAVRYFAELDPTATADATALATAVDQFVARFDPAG